MKEIIETRNVKAVKNAVRTVVNTNGILAVIGDIGAGKTTMYNVLKNHWDAYPHRFTVVEIKSFKSRYSRISAIMDFIIAACSPGETIPQVVEKKYVMLRNILRETRKKNIILVADEAQDLNLQTFRDLKKIHEIDGRGQDHLFSIILFGKTHLRWRQLLSDPELGMRMHRLSLDRLTNDEIILIAEKAHRLRFHSDRVRERFAAGMAHKNPLDVQFAARSIRFFYGVSDDDMVPVTEDTIKMLSTMTLKFQVKMLDIKQKDIAAEASKELGRNVSVQRINEVMNGTSTSKSKDKIQDVIERMINEHHTGAAVSAGSI